MLSRDIKRVAGVSRLNQLNAAFGLDNHLLAKPGPVLEDLAEHLLRFTAGINIRMVKKVDADCQCGFNRLVSLPDIIRSQRLMIPASPEAHTAQGDPAGGDSPCVKW
ncbi:hypothetical protein D3C80_1535750 [compost metagenome]